MRMLNRTPSTKDRSDRWRLRATRWLTVALALAGGGAGAASAQQAQRLELINQGDHAFLTFRAGQLSAQPSIVTGGGWFLEPAGDQGQVRIKSALTGGYLLLGGGQLTVAKAPPNAPASIWNTTNAGGALSFANAGNPNLLLDSRGGTIVADAAAPGAPTTFWMAVPIGGKGSAASAANAAQPAAPTPTAAPLAAYSALPAPKKPGGTGYEAAPRIGVPVASGRGQALPAPKLGMALPPPAASVAAPAAGTATATVQIYVVNRSNGPIDLYGSDSTGNVTWLATIRAGTGLPLQSPVGVTYHLAQNDDWVGSYKAGTAPTQVISFPRQ